jgi:predicted dehydrogenase
MAGMWMRFLPFCACLRSLLAEGAIGEAHLLTADIGVRSAFDAVRQTYDVRSDGQALVEAGTYLATLALMVFGYPRGS